jgi:hypothetical protein
MAQILSRLERLALNALTPEQKAALKRANATTRQQRHRTTHGRTSRAQSLEHYATCDFETDPFDNTKLEQQIEPFLFVLYAPPHATVRLWRGKKEDETPFLKRCIAAIEALPGKYVVYAHNGGRFDYMFLLHLLRGEVMFKGSGLMKVTIGNHELRDSIHICPGRLANYKKDVFDYTLLKRHKRHAHKDEIIQYCENDCIFLHERVGFFLRKHGYKLSIGQASMAAIKKIYEVKRIGEHTDAYLRPFFFGGRVQCLQGLTWLKEPLKLYDVNSMYPSVMAYCKHPIDGEFHEHAGQPTENTVFIELECDNHNALLARIEEDCDHGSKGSVTTELPHGIFHTTIWEYNVALKYKLISNVRIIRCLDYANRITFADWILPGYAAREKLKLLCDELEAGSSEYIKLKTEADDIKNELNNGYGKFAQDARKYYDSYITDPLGTPPVDAEKPWGYDIYGGFIGAPELVTERYAIWRRPAPTKRFNNVATGASITGAARAKLMEAIQWADYPVYCDTDSLLCRHLDASKIEINPAKLGAWKLEGEWSEAIILAKKGYFLYNSNKPEGPNNPKMVCKGMNHNGLRREVYELAYDGAVIPMRATGVTLAKDGSQRYQERKLRATAKRKT